MKTFLHSRDATSKGAALMIVLAIVLLFTGVALAYFSRTTTDRQLAQSSYNDTSADLLARSALDIVINDFKQEILNNPTVSRTNIQPSPYPIPTPGDIPNLIRYSSRNAAASRASTISSSSPSANGRSITTTRWNSHYLVPRGNPSDRTINSSPVPSFTPPDWVLVTGQGPTAAPSPNAVIGRYAFAVYDEGGLLDMNLAGYPSWSGMPDANCSPNPSATPWLVNVGRKGIVALADLTGLGQYAPLQSQVDKIVGWRNYAMTQRTSSSFPSGDPGFTNEIDCSKQDNYGSYLLYFGDPPFSVESVSDKLTASIFPFTTVANQPDTSNTRTDQRLTTRQQLLKLQRSICTATGSYDDTKFSQNVLQYMGTFSRERNWPAPDWPNLGGNLSEGRFNMNNLGLVIPNPSSCTIQHGKKVGWLKGKNRNRLCGSLSQVVELFGLFWETSDGSQTPGYWRYIDHTGPVPNGSPNPNYHSVICWRGANQQGDFFQILHYALNVARGANQTDHCGGIIGTQARTFGIGASLIDQYDAGGGWNTPGTACYQQQFGANPPRQLPGCDLDAGVSAIKYATHTTIVQYGQGNGASSFAAGMEKDYDPTTGDGDVPYNVNDNNNPHRPCGNKGGNCISGENPAPAPPTGAAAGQQVFVNHAFSNVGEFGYGIDTSVGAPGPNGTPLPTMDFSPPTFYDAPVLDFFCYNGVSSVYPRAGIVNLFTRNAPVLAAMLSQTLKTDAAAATPNPTPVITQSEAMSLANAIVAETQGVLAGAPPSTWAVTQTDMTRAIAARLAAKATTQVWGPATSSEIRNSITRALAEMGQTRTWNLLIDVIAQTGKYKPNASDLSGSNFVVEGEKRYWLHISLGRDLVHTGGTPCLTGDTGCQVDVLGTQLEEVIE